MLQRITFNLSRGYLSNSILMEKEEENYKKMDEKIDSILFSSLYRDKDKKMDEKIINRILSELSNLDGDKIECYHRRLPSGLTDGKNSFDYLLLYKFDKGFKPIIVKNCYCPSKWFEDYYKEEVSNEEYNKRFGITECDESEWNELKKTNKEFEHNYFGHADYNVNELLDLVCDSSREKFHDFLKEKYADCIEQDVLLF